MLGLSLSWKRSLAKMLWGVLALWLAFGVSGLQPFVTHAAGPDGSVDPTFQSGSGANSSISTVAVQSDGKILIAGSFTTYNSSSRNYIARLNADGSLDTDFYLGVGTNGDIYTMVVQPNGKILIGGKFTSYNGVTRNHIARLNADGSLDTLFLNTVGGADDSIHDIEVQADGKILIAGDFATYSGVGRNSIARLTSNGSLDMTFNPGSGVGGSLRGVAVQSDGKIIIGGGFTSYNGVARKCIARLNVDGTLDTTFDPGTGVGGVLYDVLVQNDGKIIIAGEFGSYNGVGRNHIARLNTNGSLDTSFLNSGTGASAAVGVLTLRGDGKILIGGVFTTYNGVSRKSIALLNPDGSYDISFNPNGGANSFVSAIVVQSDGKVLIGGNFTSYNGLTRKYIARLNSNGSLDTSFLNSTEGANKFVHTIAVQPDGKILISGSFTTYNAIPRNHIARLNADGSLDTSFDPGTGMNGTVYPVAYAIVVQPDGKILIAGKFTTYNEIPRNGIARLNPDGSLDTSFDPGTGANDTVYAMVVQLDGKILIGGNFTTYNGTNRNRIARLNANGSLEASFFNTSAGPAGAVTSIAVQPDGKVLIGGNFATYNGIGRNNIVRINTDGSLDAGFNSGSGTNGTLNAIALQTDGKIVIGGNFTTYNATPRNHIARLNANGSLDTGFDPSGSTNNSVSALVVQANGKILIVGSFDTYTGIKRRGIARINPDGSLDTGFDPGEGAIDNGSGNVGTSVHAIAVQADGKVLIGGEFRSVDTYTRDRIARLENTAAPCDPLLVTTGTDNGAASTCGTFSYAVLSATSGMTITFNVPSVTFTGVLTPTLQSGVIINGAAFGVTLDGGTLASDGLTLGGSNHLINITVKGFSGRGLVVPAGKTNNKLERVRVVKT